MDVVRINRVEVDEAPEDEETVEAIKKLDVDPLDIWVFPESTSATAAPDGAQVLSFSNPSRPGPTRRHY